MIRGWWFVIPLNVPEKDNLVHETSLCSTVCCRIQHHFRVASMADTLDFILYLL